MKRFLIVAAFQLLFCDEHRNPSFKLAVDFLRPEEEIISLFTQTVQQDILVGQAVFDQTHGHFFPLFCLMTEYRTGQHTSAVLKNILYDILRQTVCGFRIQRYVVEPEVLRKEAGDLTHRAASGFGQRIFHDKQKNIIKEMVRYLTVFKPSFNFRIAVSAVQN